MIEKEETIPKMSNLQLIEGLEIGTEKLPSTVEQLSEKSERSLKTVDFGMQSNVQSNSEEIIEIEENNDFEQSPEIQAFAEWTS